MKLATLIFALTLLAGCKQSAPAQAQPAEPIPAVTVAEPQPSEPAAPALTTEKPKAAEYDHGAIHGLPFEPFDEARAEACSVGCAHPIEDYEPSDVVDQPGAKVGQLARCPISGVIFQITEESPSVEWDGKQYYVCCGGCAERLKADLPKG